MNAIHLIDGYKTGHIKQYPEGTQLVYSNFTPRSSRVPGQDSVVFFGMSYFIQRYLKEEFDNFFSRPIGSVIKEYKRRMDGYLGKDAVDAKHIAELHELGYLPIRIQALREGSVVPIGVPMFTVWNTDERFYWLTNYLETLMSCVLWGPTTSATTAYRYKKLLHDAAVKTGGDLGFIPYQAHDFSMRGMYGVEAAMLSGAAHLIFFKGTDCIPAIDFIEKYYPCETYEESPSLIGISVPATEHSVMCMGGMEDEFGTFERLITKVYPNGIVSVVSDTWDFWKVVTEYLPRLKDAIMARDGKLVIRPDSGDPVDILCGLGIKNDPPVKYEVGKAWEYKGLIECLWDIFGCTVNEKGYKVLDPHIGAIYGDSITVERAEAICERLAAKGFASTNVVFGIGSYTYQYVTRDTYGMAMKATWGMVNGQPRDIFKSPKTDSGTKKSARGLLSLFENKLVPAVDAANPEDAHLSDSTICVFRDGVATSKGGPTFDQVRVRANYGFES